MDYKKYLRIFQLPHIRKEMSDVIRIKPVMVTHLYERVDSKKLNVYRCRSNLNDGGK